MKQRATLDEQINTLVSHGVTFDLMDEEKARRFLSNNSYFFKIKSYENNYRKTIDESGGYVYDNLDFGHLVELSLVDFALSRLVWSMCSSIEHSIKVRFNQLIMKDQNPDIADICVRRCFSGNLPTMHDNPYTDDMKTGLQGDFALWNLWELCSTPTGDTVTTRTTHISISCSSSERCETPYRTATACSPT